MREYEMLGYAMVGSNDLTKAKEFYEKLFSSVGFARLVDLKAGGACWGPPGWGRGSSTSMFCVVSPIDGQPACFGNGTMIGFALDSPEDVDRIYEAAMAMGGHDEGEPGLREINISGFYGAYFRDLDNNKLVAYHIVEPGSAQSKTLRKLY